MVPLQFGCQRREASERDPDREIGVEAARRREDHQPLERGAERLGQRDSAFRIVVGIVESNREGRIQIEAAAGDAGAQEADVGAEVEPARDGDEVRLKCIDIEEEGFLRGKLRIEVEPEGKIQQQAAGRVHGAGGIGVDLIDASMPPA